MTHQCSSLGTVGAHKKKPCHSSMAEAPKHHQKLKPTGLNIQSHGKTCPFCALKACKKEFVPSQSFSLVEVLQGDLSFSLFQFDFLIDRTILIQLVRGPPPELPKPLVYDWQSLYSVYII